MVQLKNIEILLHCILHQWCPQDLCNRVVLHLANPSLSIYPGKEKIVRLHTIEASSKSLRVSPLNSQIVSLSHQNLMNPLMAPPCKSCTKNVNG